ncbi:hypothetical protein [Streptomyces collinus]|uniref:hypothetical protein n=1 Tax=Streptomyces collinus TaxID=42684 RepID=UPI0033324EE5
MRAGRRFSPLSRHRGMWAAGLAALPALVALGTATPAMAAAPAHHQQARQPVRYVQVSNTQTCNPDGLCTITATCPSGTVVTGGGVSETPLISSGVYLMESEPTSSRTWRGTLRNASQFPVQVTVTAVCARIPGV